MSFYIIQDNITLKNKDELIAAHIYMQFIKDGIHFSQNDINVIVELYKMNGYKNKEEQEQFFKACLERGYKNAAQSLRNTLNKYTEAGFLIKPKNLQRFISKDFIPQFDSENVGAIYKLTYANNE